MVCFYGSNNNPLVVSLFIPDPLLPVLFNPNHPETRFYRVSPRVIGLLPQRVRRGGSLRREHDSKQLRKKDIEKERARARDWEPRPSSGREHHLLAGWCLNPLRTSSCHTLSPTWTVAYTFLFDPRVLSLLSLTFIFPNITLIISYLYFHYIRSAFTLLIFNLW